MSIPSLPTQLSGGAELALETRALHKRYGSTTALDSLGLQVPAGAIYVLAGPNGAGKSTALGALLGLVRPDGGTAHVLGLDPAREPARVRAQTGYGWLTAERFLRHHSVVFSAWDAGYAATLCHRLGVRVGERMRNLSKGAVRAVMLVTALAHRPPVLLLDEPTDGLDPLAREELGSVLVDHVAESPTTVLWCTHHVHEVERLADHVGILHGGRLLLQAPRDVLRGRLRRYRAQVPDGWAGAPGLNGEVLLREGAGREIAWTVWGEEREVAGRLAEAGAAVREASVLSLEDATVALLRAGRQG